MPKKSKQNTIPIIIPKGGCRVSFKALANESPKDAYTGDYDLHDIIMPKENHRLHTLNTKCPTSKPETKAICLLNQSINRKCNTSDVSSKHCQLIRHGAQANYFQYQQEKEELLRPSLVSISKKILVIEPRTKKDECSYHLLGKQKDISVLNEYLNLYRAC